MSLGPANRPPAGGESRRRDRQPAEEQKWVPDVPGGRAPSRGAGDGFERGRRPGLWVRTALAEEDDRGTLPRGMRHALREGRLFYFRTCRVRREKM